MCQKLFLHNNYMNKALKKNQTNNSKMNETYKENDSTIR